MSAARLAAEAAFADPGIALERQPAAAVVIEVRPRRIFNAPAADEQLFAIDDSQLPPGDRLPRVFRMDPALRHAMGLPNVDDGAPAPIGSTAGAPLPTRRRRQAAPPVHIVHAAVASAAVTREAAMSALPQLPMTAHWAPIACALAELEATFAAIRAAQDFNAFAELHLPLSAAATPHVDQKPSEA